MFFCAIISTSSLEQASQKVRDLEVKAVWIAALMILSCGILFAEAPKPHKDRAVYIYLLSQTLRCYEADEIVISTNISSGKGWGAPDSKKKLRYRSQYRVLHKDPRGAKATSKVKVVKKDKKGNVTTTYITALTPWKVILSWDYGHYVRLHGYHSVPKIPASHGCFREPIKVSEEVYNFVEAKTKDFEGTPVYIINGRAPKIKK